MRVAVLTLATVLCGAATNLFAQHHEALVGGHVPREILERPVPLRTGIGAVKHATSSASPEAQAFYEQGLAYLHSYVWIEAARSFNQALRLDSTLALAWVGLSRAYMGLDDDKAADEAQAQAQKLASGVTPREQRWIAIRTAQLEAIRSPSDGTKRLAYIAAIDQALEHDPDDAELWTLRGNADEVALGAAGRGQRGGSSSIVFYEEALRRVPGHFGAHHYLIHSNEFVGRFEDALKHGQAYSSAAPRVPHAQHMYGHDLMKTGRIAEAIDIFKRARALEREYYASEKISRDYDWHHAHNTTLLALSYRHMGKIAEAQKLLEDAASVQQASERREAYYRALFADLLLARGKPDEALAIARSLVSLPADAGREFGHVFAARALLAKGQAAEAREHVEALSGRTDGGERRGYGFDLALPRGELALRTGRRDEGVRLLAEVLARARRQRSPDGWIEGLFTLESIFSLARTLGEWELARKASALLLEHDKAYGGSQYAAAIVAEHDGNTAAAAAARAEAARLWKSADPDHDPVRDLRSR